MLCVKTPTVNTATYSYPSIASQKSHIGRLTAAIGYDYTVYIYSFCKVVMGTKEHGGGC